MAPSVDNPVAASLDGADVPDSGLEFAAGTEHPASSKAVATASMTGFTNLPWSVADGPTLGLLSQCQRRAAAGPDELVEWNNDGVFSEFHRASG